VSETQTDFMFTPAGLAAPPLGKGLAVFHGSVDGGPPGVFLRSSRGRIIPVDFPSDAHRREARYLAWSTPADFAKPGQYIVVVSFDTTGPDPKMVTDVLQVLRPSGEILKTAVPRRLYVAGPSIYSNVSPAAPVAVRASYAISNKVYGDLPDLGQRYGRGREGPSDPFIGLSTFGFSEDRYFFSGAGTPDPVYDPDVLNVPSPSTFPVGPFAGYYQWVSDGISLRNDADLPWPGRAIIQGLDLTTGGFTKREQSYPPGGALGWPPCSGSFGGGAGSAGYLFSTTPMLPMAADTAIVEYPVVPGVPAAHFASYEPLAAAYFEATDETVVVFRKVVDASWKWFLRYPLTFYWSCDPVGWSVWNSIPGHAVGVEQGVGEQPRGAVAYGIQVRVNGVVTYDDMSSGITGLTRSGEGAFPSDGGVVLPNNTGVCGFNADGTPAYPMNWGVARAGGDFVVGCQDPASPGTVKLFTSAGHLGDVTVPAGFVAAPGGTRELWMSERNGRLWVLGR